MKKSVRNAVNSIRTSKPYKGLEHLVDKLSECRTETKTGMWLCNDELCVAIIRYYDRKGNEKAQFTFDKFVTIGFNAWVQSITGWQFIQPAPKPKLEVIMPTAEEITFMRSREWEKAELESLSGTRQPMTAQEIMQRSGYNKLFTKLK